MAGKCVTYRRLVDEITSQRLAYNGSPLTDLLCRVSQTTYSEKGVLLSAVVVRKREGTPGRGFFDFASQILKLDVGEDEEAFWRKQVRMVHETEWG